MNQHKIIRLHKIILLHVDLVKTMVLVHYISKGKKKLRSVHLRNRTN